MDRIDAGEAGVPSLAQVEAVARDIVPVSREAMLRARERQARLAKPPGALGVLEDVSVLLCGVAGTCPPPALQRPVVVVFAGDHGVHAQGVTPWPQEVTTAMVATIGRGGAAVSVLARRAGAEVVVVDAGVAGDLDAAYGAWDRKVRRGTDDLTRGPAMSLRDAVTGVLSGVAVAEELIDTGHDVLLTGDMGIANTTPSAALVCAFTGADPAAATGRGTGADEQTWARKVAAVETALSRGIPEDPVAVLASMGGLEHAGLVGLVLGAARRRVPVVLDGVIAGAAALVAQVLAPESVDYCIAGHRSVEPGHALALTQLGLRPLVDLDLRLGEGTGAVLAYPVVDSAGAVLREMATLDTTGVTG